MTQKTTKKKNVKKKELFEKTLVKKYKVVLEVGLVIVGKGNGQIFVEKNYKDVFAQLEKQIGFKICKVCFSSENGIGKISSIIIDKKCPVLF